MLDQLEKLEGEVEDQKYGRFSAAIKLLRDYSSSADKANNFWMDCMKVVEFDEKGKTGAEFADWKRKQTKEANHKRDDGLQLQLRWLMIALMDASARTPSAEAEVISAASLYLDDLLVYLKKHDGAADGLAGNVTGSIFTRQLKLDGIISRPNKEDEGKKREGSTPGNPADLSGIYESLILPYYRQNKMASSLMNAWTKRIAQETAIAETPNYKEALEKFTKERRPELEWGKARELFQLGQQENGAVAMMSLIRANLTHRNAANWTRELRSMIEASQVAPVEAPPAGESGTAPQPPTTPPGRGVAPSRPPGPGAVPPARPPGSGVVPPPPAEPSAQPEKPVTEDPTKEAVENPFGN